ncbi:MAG: DUF4465 domain-containing protein [Phycisphaeraceae bacterium]
MTHPRCHRSAVACAIALSAILTSNPALAGPFSAPSDDPTHPIDPPISSTDPRITAWNGSLADYSPAPGVNPNFDDPTTGFASLGDLYDPNNPPPTGQIPPFSGITIPFSGDINDTTDPYGFTGIDNPGSATIQLAHPIVDGPGFDLAVFENGFTTSANQLFAELAFVEVSSDGTTFARFPSTSLSTPDDLIGSGAFTSLDTTNVHNLAGKHASGWGTPFDLAQLNDHPAVTTGDINLKAITHLRLVDIPGTGFFTDTQGNPILDAHPTLGSAGFDLSFNNAGVALLTPPNALPGDINNDNIITPDDINTLTDNFNNPDFDLTGDRLTNQDDLTRLVTDLLNTHFGDTNLDHAVDLIDLSTLASNFGVDFIQPPGWGLGDFNADHTIDLIDLSTLAANFGNTTTSIPTPSSLTLTLLGCRALLRRQQQQNPPKNQKLRAPGASLGSGNPQPTRDHKPTPTNTHPLTPALLALALTTPALATTTITFDDLIPPGPDYFTGAGFTTQNTQFTGGVFAGWTYANVNNTTDPSFSNQYAAFTGTDFSGDGNYAIAFGNGSYINLPPGRSPESAYITNTTYTALTIRDGNPFSKPFGGLTGGDPDRFTVTLTAYTQPNGQGTTIGAPVEVVLADYTFADNSLDFILNTWLEVDLTPLTQGNAGGGSIGLSFFSTDTGDFGINTPTYIALDNLTLIPTPASATLLALATLSLTRRRKHTR